MKVGEADGKELFDSNAADNAERGIERRHNDGHRRVALGLTSKIVEVDKNVLIQIIQVIV